MALLTVAGWIAWAAFLVMSHAGPRPAPVAARPAIRWIWAGWGLIYADVTLMMIVGNDVRVVRRAAAAGGLVLTAAGAACLVAGLVTMRRRSRLGRPRGARRA